MFRYSSIKAQALFSVFFLFCFFPGFHAAPVVGRQPAGQCQVRGVRQKLWQCAAAAGLALPLVQGHRT